MASWVLAFILARPFFSSIFSRWRRAFLFLLESREPASHRDALQFSAALSPRSVIPAPASSMLATAYRIDSGTLRLWRRHRVNVPTRRSETKLVNSDQQYSKHVAHEIHESHTKNDPFRVIRVIRGPKNARSQFVKARFFIENALGFVEKRLRFLG